MIIDRYLTPEEALIVALIENAVQDIVIPPRNFPNYYRKQAIRWFESKDTTPFTYLWCMEMLDISSCNTKYIFETINKVKDLTRGKNKKGLFITK